MKVLCPKCGKVGELYNTIEPYYKCKYGARNGCSHEGFEDEFEEVDESYEDRKYINSMGIKK